MRGRKVNSRSNGRRRRRCVLAGLLVASGQVAMADWPVAVAPLPLAISAAQDSGKLQVNPFCQPVPAAPSDLVELQRGAAGAPLPAQADAVCADGMAEIVRAYPGRVISAAPGQPREDTPWVIQSSGRHDQEQIDSAGDGGPRMLVQQSAQNVGGSVRSNPLAGAVEMRLSDVPRVKPLVVAAERPAPPSGAVAFSFSDEHAAPIDLTAVSPHTSSVPSAVRPSVPADPAQPAPQSQPRNRAAWAAPHVETADQSQQPAATIARPSMANRTILVPIEDTSAAYEASAIGGARLPEPTSRPVDEARLVNGSRPKVEVGRPPLAVHRGNLSLTEEPSPPSQNPAAGLASPESKAAEPTVVTRLHFKPTEVRALKTENTIRKVDVQSNAVCTVLRSGPSQLQLIATGEGVAKLKLWTEDSSGQPQCELYEIHVAAVADAQTSDLQAMAATLTQSVGKAFPNSKVAIRYEGGRLMATGNCQDEESARRILRMVRSACRMPVDDKVLVR